MTLPKIAAPTFEIELPVSKQKIRYRPWLMKDKKIVLIALQSNDDNMMREAVFTVMNACVLTEGIDIKTLPATDLSWLMLNVRKHSDSDVIPVAIGMDCAEQCTQRFNVNLSDVTVKTFEGHNPKIMLTETIGMKMRSITLEEAQTYAALADVDSDVTAYLDVLGMCIETIFSGDDAWPVKDLPREEVREFLDQLTSYHFVQINKYFETMPTLYYKVERKCQKCGKMVDLELKSIRDFFV